MRVIKRKCRCGGHASGSEDNYQLYQHTGGVRDGSDLSVVILDLISGFINESAGETSGTVGRLENSANAQY